MHRPCQFPLAAATLAAGGCRTREQAHERGICARLWAQQTGRTTHTNPRSST